MRPAMVLLLAAVLATGEAHPTIHISSERPWYRPGETACLRALLLDAVSRVPLDSQLPVCLRVRDGRGQVVWNGLAEVADGVAAAGWPVPDLGGSYSVEATVGTRAAAEPRRILVARTSSVPAAIEAELQFDRRGYAPGETAGISLVLRDRTGQPLADRPAVLRIALADGTEREERVVSDAQGRASISLAIPASLERRSGTVTASLPGDAGGVVASRSIPLASVRLELRAEVEGGTLVAGRAAVVFVQARSEDGQPADCRGALVDAEGRSLATFSARHEGRARLGFTPQAGASYRIVLAAPVVQELALAAVQASGATLAGDAIQPADRPLRLRLDAPAGRYLVRVLRRGRLVAEQQVALGTAQDLALDPAGAAGVMDVVVQAADGTVLVQRTLFRRPTRSIALALEAPAVIGPQQAIAVGLRLTGPDGRPLPGLCSLAVVEAGDEDPIEVRERPPRLPALAWLDGEVEDLADSGSYLAADGAASERLDLLLGVQSWRRGQTVADGGRFRRLRSGEAPILRWMLAPALDLAPAALAVADSEMGGSGLFMAIGAGGGAAGLFGQRTGGGRKRALARNGGTRASEAGVWASGRFLKRTQSPDGRWSAVHWPKSSPFEQEPEGLGTWTGPSADRCGTALSLLTFLGAGYDHKTPSKYKPLVRNGIVWLQSQLAADGTVDADPVVQACVTMVLAEAYAMTSDPELRQPAQLLIERLLRMQHPVGGWAASGRSDDPRLDGPASAWCVMALKSAYAGGLDVHGGLERAKHYLELAWRAANPVPGPVSTFPGTFDAVAGTAHAPACTAAGAMMAVYLGHRIGDQMLESLADALAESPPRAAPIDPMTLLWGNLAMFQVGGERWQLWNLVVRDFLIAQQRVGEPYDGSWDPDLFGASGARWGRVMTSAICALSLEVYYRYSPVRNGGERLSAPVRADLRRALSPGQPDEALPPGTLAWWAAEPTAADGRLSLQLPAAGRGRRLTLRADAMDAAGGFTAVEGVLEVRAPVEVAVRLPGSLLVGDRWEVPCTARGADARAEAVGGACSATLADGHLLLSAVAPGQAQVRVSAVSDAGSDARAREVAILPPGAPWRASGRAQGSGRIDLPQQGFLPGGLRGAIVIERGFDAVLEAVHECFRREPHGCFEQTSSVSHPLALSSLRRLATGRPADPVASAHLAAAVARLQGFACPGGGFSLFGRDPGDPVLTAYGLRQFRLLGKLTPVDPQLLARQQAWLLDRRDPSSGGFAPGAASADPLLCQVQISADLAEACPVEDRQRAYAAAERLGTAYALGLAARLARACDEPAIASALMARVQRLPDGAVARPGASPWRPEAAVEAVALAVLDSLATQRNDEAQRSLAWLAARRWGAAWDITQANVLAIEAFAAAERLQPGSEAARLSVRQGGRLMGELVLPVGARGLHTMPLLVEPGGAPLEVQVDGPQQIWRWEVEGRVERPQDAPDAPLSFALHLPPRLVVGQPCELLARVKATAAVYAPLLRLGIPAGLEPRAEALDRLVRARRIASWEAVDGEVRIYGELLADGALWEVPIACVAVAAGSFRGAASSALPYYEPLRVAWQPGRTLVIDR